MRYSGIHVNVFGDCWKYYKGASHFNGALKDVKYIACKFYTRLNNSANGFVQDFV